MMDFGLDKFIEMFESRFGRKATTGLLALIGVGIASAMVHTIAKDFLIPVYNVILSLIDTGAFAETEYWFRSITKNEIIAICIEILFLSFCSNIYFNKIQRSALKNLKKLIEDDPKKFLQKLVDVINADGGNVISLQVLPPATQEPPQPQSET